MVSAVLLPNAKAAFITSSGAPAVGYKLYTYDAGTLVPRPTYLDAAGGASNTNPIILDARGEAVIYWDGSYKVILKDAADVTIWTVDNFTNSFSALVLTVAAGAVGAPSITAAGDTNTGFWFPAADTIAVSTGGTERWRVDSNGRMAVNAGISASTRFYVLDTAAATIGILSTNSNAAPGAATLGYFTFAGAAPNDTVAFFMRCQDNAANRLYITSNGGIYNFSANNVNLSDIKVKPEFARHTDAELDALQASFTTVDWGKFKYGDQTHDDWNYGYSAQGVEAAFAASVPALTEIWNPTTTVEADDGTGQMVRVDIPTPIQDQLKGVFTEDLHNIAHALLARALTKIAALEARLSAAGIP